MNETKISYPRILPVGDAALTIEFGNTIDLQLNQKVIALEHALQSNQVAEVIEWVPSYRSLLVLFDPWLGDVSTIEAKLYRLLQNLPTKLESSPRIIEIPVQYGGESGPDLEFVAEHSRLTPQEVIEVHAKPVYPIYMMGFTPGFPYLGGMDARIAAPRLETPRTLVPAGSVGIAGQQTGIYSIDSPGGWRIIGKTELTLYDPARENPFLLSPGDQIRFVPIKDGSE